MLNYKILENKSIITKNNNTFIDLLGDTYMYNENDIKGFPLLINKYYVARPDLVALAIYGDDKYGDIICKVNGISNPFELNVGMKLIIPSESNFTSFLKVGKPTDKTTTNNEIGVKLKNNQKRKNERRSPGEQTVGDSLFTIDRDNYIVFY